MGRPISNVASRVAGKRLPWVPVLVFAVVFMATATARAETGRITLKVTKNGILVQDAEVSIHTPSGESLDMQVRTIKAGSATFIVPPGSYKFCVDHFGDRTWSYVVHTLPDEETEVELVLEQLAKDKTLDPHPARFDGIPPEKEPVMLASLAGLSGILTQSTVAAVSKDRLYWFVNDHLGAPKMIIDENQKIVWQGSGTPFGETAITVNAIENNFRFPGQYFDAESGLHYNYYRYYDPSVGRYLRADPIGLAGMDPNPFGYSRNNSINLTDSNGLLTSSYYNSHGYSDYEIDYGMAWVSTHQRYNSNHNVLKKLAPDHITTAGVLLTEEFVADWYSSDKGFLPSECSDINFSTALIGGGINFSWDTSTTSWGGDYTIEVGIFKHLGVTYNPIKRKIGLSIGASVSLPFVNFSVPVLDNAIGPL